jgi:phage gp29-like protein
VKKAPKTTTTVSRERVTQFLRARYNPLSNLTPERLTQLENDWDNGTLRDYGLALDRIKSTDDMLVAVASKREKAPGTRGWEVLTLEESDRAQQHADALTYFYNNLRATSAVDENERGGASLMLRQMMGAVGLRYAVHEIIWKPSAAGITAELRAVPVWFFENRGGRLRYIASEGAYTGEELSEGAWMVTVGDGLMRPSARAWMFKHLPLRDWLIYCNRHGMPGFIGKTDATPGSTQWTDVEDAVQNMAAEFAAVVSTGTSLEKLDLTAQGQIPYPALVERMDRAMSIIWRGGDLSTLSQGGDAAGVTGQNEERDILDAADIEMLNEACQQYLDRWVIHMQFGEDPLAYFSIKGRTKKNVDQDLKTDEALVRMGVPLSITETAERYNRKLADDGEPTLAIAPAALGPAMPGMVAANADPVTAPNDKLLAQAVGRALDVRAKWLEPFFADLEAKAADKSLTEADFLAALEQARKALPELLTKEHIEAAAAPLRELLETGLVNAIEGRTK